MPNVRFRADMAYFGTYSFITSGGRIRITE